MTSICIYKERCVTAFNAHTYNERQNLTIVNDALVAKVLLEDSQTIGVIVNGRREFLAHGKSILSGGALNIPQALSSLVSEQQTKSINTMVSHGPRLASCHIILSQVFHFLEQYPWLRTYRAVAIPIFSLAIFRQLGSSRYDRCNSSHTLSSCCSSVRTAKLGPTGDSPKC